MQRNLSRDQYDCKDQKPTTSPADHQTVINLMQSPPTFAPSPLRSNGSPAPSITATGTPKAPPRPTLTPLPVSKPKSRFVELNYPPASSLKPDSAPVEHHHDDDSEEDEDQPISDKFLPLEVRRRRRIRWRALVETSALVLLSTCLVLSLTLFPSRRRRLYCGLEIWEWTLMVLVVFCGRLVSGWLVWSLVFLLERHFPLSEKVLYFVYGLRKSVRGCVWLALVLLSWILLFDLNHSRRGRARSPFLRFVSRALIAILVSASIWLLKIVLVKMLASSFHVATFFDRMKVSVFHHYIVEALSVAEPIDDDGGDERKEAKVSTRLLAGAKTMPARLGSRRIDMERLRRLSRAGATACSVRRLVGHVMKSGLSTLSRTVEETAGGGRRFGETAEEEISSEWEARASAERIFKNVARCGNKFIEEEDLLKFLTEEEVRTIFPLFEGALETGKIKKSAFRNWVVRAYRERKSLAHALNDTKTAVQQLHKLASAVVIVIIIVVSLLVMGVASTKLFVVLTSQLLLVGFMFQNTGKTIFESIVFVFVMHPFDVGDRCVIDGVQMIVEEMNILTTVFLRFDNEKIYYPNAVLLTKPISNFYRSPDMGDTIEFSIDVATSVETVSALRKSIQVYLESKSKHWHPKHSVLVKEIENVNKMKMALNVLHTMNYQNFPERNNRRSELVFELKKIFEGLGIKYHLLPQEVHLTQVVMADGRLPLPTSAPKQI